MKLSELEAAIEAILFTMGEAVELQQPHSRMKIPAVV